MSTNTIVAPEPRNDVATMIADDHGQHPDRVRGQPVAQPEAAEQQAGEDEEEQDVGAVRDGRELADEPASASLSS